MVNFIVYIKYFSPVTISKAAYQMLACHSIKYKSQKNSEKSEKYILELNQEKNGSIRYLSLIFWLGNEWIAQIYE